jgi:hypothetical protein
MLRNPSQGAIGGAVPGPVDVMEAPEDGNAIRSMLGYPKEVHITKHI